MAKKVVHKLTKDDYGDFSATACGKGAYSVDSNYRWKTVSCKKCLKSKK